MKEKGADKMTLQEKFEDIIDCIEQLVIAGNPDIPQALARDTGLNLRLLGDAFQFITDMTLIKYVRQRRLVHALTLRIELGLSVEDVAADAGFSDAAAFSKACKNEFDLTPIQITEDVLKQYPPLSFDRVVSGGDAIQMENDAVTTMKNDMICGVSPEQFAQIKQVLELGAIYGLSDEEAEFVYRMAQHCQISTAQAADFYDDFKLQIENGSVIAGPDLFEMAELACRQDLSFSEAQSIMYELSRHGYSSLRQLPDTFFDIYFSKENEQHGWDVPYICEIADALEENGLSAAHIDDYAFHATMFNVDIIEAINNYEEFKASWDEAVADVMHNGIPEDDTGGFGYRSIWEFDEE
jgi:AraC-like DNA-binding protein